VRNLVAGGVVLATLFAAFVIEAAARQMAALFAQFGADLPYPTLVTIEAVKNYVPWIVAAVSVAAILVLRIRGSGRLPHACAAIAGVVTFLASCAMLALVLPIMKCGFSWPDWPAAMTESGKQASAPAVALVAGTPKREAEVSCK
jgi:hypothetical protein